MQRRNTIFPTVGISGWTDDSLALSGNICSDKKVTSDVGAQRSTTLCGHHGRNISRFLKQMNASDARSASA